MDSVDVGGQTNYDATGDSSAGMFLNDNGVWKLAGINYSVENPFNDSFVGNGFNAAIFDKGGLYTGSSSLWVPVPDTPSDQPQLAYCTRISNRTAWINSVLSIPEPTVVLETASNPAGSSS